MAIWDELNDNVANSELFQFKEKITGKTSGADDKKMLKKQFH